MSGRPPPQPAARHLIAQGLGLAVSRGVLVIVMVVVARQVGLAGFGGFAAAFVAFQAGMLLRDAGLGQGLIVLGGREPGLIRTAFVVASAAGIALGIALALFADPLAGLLNVPASAPLMRVLALAFAIGSFGVASNATLERERRFTTRAAVDILAYLGLGAATLGLLATGIGPAALAWGFVVHAAIQSVTAIVLAPPWGDERAGHGAVRRLAGYSGLLWASALLGYLGSNADNVLVARLGGSEALGAYALSYALGCTITISIAQVVNRVALPYYAASATGAERTVRSMVPLAVALAGVPATVLILGAPEIAAFALGPGVGVVPLILLTVYGVVRACGMSVGTALNGTGRAASALQGSAISVGSLILLIPPAFVLAGLAGAAAAVLVAMLAGTGFLLDRASRTWPGALDPTARWLAGAVVLVGMSLAVQGLPLLVRIGLGVLLGVILGHWARRSFNSRSLTSLPVADV